MRGHQAHGRAVHLYMTARCAATTGCTVEALEVPRKMLATSSAPAKLAMPVVESLSQPSSSQCGDGRLLPRATTGYTRPPIS